jgi:hypothetical protein
VFVGTHIGRYPRVLILERGKQLYTQVVRGKEYFMKG